MHYTKHCFTVSQSAFWAHTEVTALSCVVLDVREGSVIHVTVTATAPLGGTTIRAANRVVLDVRKGPVINRMVTVNVLRDGSLKHVIKVIQSACRR